MQNEHPSLFDKPAVMQAIAAAERQTSGEIRVVVYPRGVDDAIEVAKQEFLRLGMQRTRERNAVLVLVAPASRAFAIIGDEGVNARCGPQFWHEIAAGMEVDFKAGRFTGGVVTAVEKVGAILARHFPRQDDDSNELPDDVIERGIVI